jgi:hypothetical protein
MTAKIQKGFDLQMGVHFNDEFHINIYDIELYFNVETESITEQNIALDRIKYYLNDCLEDCVVCYQNKDKAIENYINAGIKVCTLPEEPYDQIIGIMLVSKLNAIIEGKLVITDISIGSKMSDGVSFQHALDEDIGPFSENGWWNESNTKINDCKVTGKGKKIVRLTKNSPIISWEDVYLDWEIKKPYIENFNANEVVFIEFGSKTDK